MLLRPALLALLAAVPAVAGDTPTVTHWSFHERIVIRIPRLRPAGRQVSDPDAPLRRWKEKGGPHCIGAGDIGGASIGASDAVDFEMADGKRLRARLDRDCPSLDFYKGFYIVRAADGQVCARRDAIRSRSGAACPIRAFRKLVAERWR